MAKPSTVGSGTRCRLARARCLLGSAAILSLVSTGHAQTWTPPRTTPVVPELIAVDATGEDNWLFGAEDLAGDGLDTFRQQERSIDLRTVYAVADADDLWVRSYVSDTSAPGGNVSVYVFLDTDDDPDTGGSAVAPEIDTRFDADPTEGGYELVIGVDGNGQLAGAWGWSDADGEFVALDPLPMTVEIETGEDVDPILINEDEHGYLQFSIALDDVDLTQSCRAGIFVRSLNETGALGVGDLNVGARTRCTTVDTNNDQVPDPLVPRAECTADAECPGDGICIDGSCVIPASCIDDADCESDEVCRAAGYCVFDSSTTSCTADGDCGDLICDTDQSLCVACTDDASCGSDRRCASTGRCVDSGDAIPPSGGGTGGTSGTGGSMGTGGSGTGGSGTGGDGLDIGDDETVEGGAFNCQWGGPSLPRSTNAWWIGLFVVGFSFVERRRRARSRHVRLDLVTRFVVRK